MYEWFSSLNSVFQALIATLFTWAITISGASIVLLFKNIKKNFMDIMLAISGGVMLSASFFSLILPSLEMASNLKMNPNFLIPIIGILSGGLFLYIGDKIFDYYNNKNKKENKMKRIIMFIFSITLHNIPEGLVIGVAFGSIASNLDGATLVSAILLAIGIGIQNFPEGSAVSLPLKRIGMSSKKAFIFGCLTGIVEPISGVIGAVLVTEIRTLLPFFLSFAAGAMIYVVTEEIIPESQKNEKKELISLFTLIGFSIMMLLDVALG